MSEEQQLIDAYLDGELTSEEQGRFAEWLAADAEHVRQFVRETHVHRQIREVMLARAYRAYGLLENEPAARKTKAAPVRWLGGQLGPLLGFRWWPSLRGSLAALAACLVLAITMGFWYFGPTMGDPVLAEVRGGELSVERAGRLLAGLAGARLQAGDILRTPDNVTATISFAPEQTRLTLQPGTELKLMDRSRGKRFTLGAGHLVASVARQRPFWAMILKTPQAEARVLGTRFELSVSPNSTRLDVTQGKVRFTRISDEKCVPVGAGHYAVAAVDYELAALPFTGSILMEWWSGLAPKTVNDLRAGAPFPDRPDSWDLARTFELAPVETNGVGVRFRGYLHPPVTGDYEFWLAGATAAQLFMSPNDNPAEAVRVAQVSGGSPNLWDQPRFQGGSPWAPPIPLVAGRRYYLEADVVIEHGEGHLSVAWKRPGQSRQLLTGEFLSPYKSK